MRKQIIIIDDDDAVRDSMHVFLECTGFEVNSFNSGKQFLSAGSYDTVCCFVVDVHMPEMTGVGFLERVHGTHPHLPVILVSGNTSKFIRNRAERAGALAILEKPFEQSKLLETLKTVCPFFENLSPDKCI